MELATDENTVLALPPIKRMVPITITRITASMTAYSAISCPSSSRHNLLARSVIIEIPPKFVSLPVPRRFHPRELDSYEPQSNRLSKGGSGQITVFPRAFREGKAFARASFAD